MARINLLPWRDELRRQRQREFATAAGGLSIVMLLIILYVHMHIGGQIDTQQSRNDYLRREIKEVDARIKEIQDLEKQKQQLIARMKVIEQLQRNRPEVVYVLDELVRAVPDGLFLTAIKQSNATINVDGVAQSNSRVSAFMRNLESSTWFKNPNLQVIQIDSKSSQRARNFTLQVNLAALGEKS